MVSGHVETISPDAAELPDTRERDRKDTREHVMPPSGFRTLVVLDSPYLERDGKQYRVSASMVVSAEVKLGSRNVMEYLLSPVQKVTHEAGREMQSVVEKSQIEQNTYARCRLELAPISLSQRRKVLDRNAGTDSKSNYY
jgi:hypothetical protein